MEEVKAILKTLSLEQKMEARKKESNDRVAFLQSGRVEDRVLRVCEERCYLSGESKNESEIDSPSNEEETDEMPALTDSDMSEIEESEKERFIPPLTDRENSESESKAEGGRNQKYETFKNRGRNKKILKKRKTRITPEPMSETSDDYPETESDETTEDDYSDEDHVYLISSVANLRRRELMNLKPLRTKSKKTPKVREKPL